MGENRKATPYNLSPTNFFEEMALEETHRCRKKDENGAGLGDSYSPISIPLLPLPPTKTHPP